MTEKIYVLLPVYNRREITRRFIECLKAQTYENYQLILIDDGSTDGTAEMVLGYLPETVVLRGKGNWWWAGSLQQGIEWLKNEHVADDSVILMINDDTVFEPDFLATAVEVLSGVTEALLLAQCYSLQDNKLVDAGVHVDWRRLTFEQARTEEEINCFSTRGLFMRMKDLRAVGDFHPRILPHYASDYEFTIRAHRKGLKLMTDSRLKIWEDEETTGHHSINGLTLWSSIKIIFSKKSVWNPFYWAVFVVLSCPSPLILKNLVRVFYRALRLIFFPPYKKGK